MANTNVAIIGKIPGYGSVLDEKNTFGKILLRDITYIDLIPASYSINTGMLGKSGSDFSNFYLYTSGDTKSSVYKIFQNIIGNLATHALNQFESGLRAYPGVIDTVNISDIVEYATEIINIWKRTTSIRILGANDSTFTETISNNFTNNDSGGNINRTADKIMDKMMPTVTQLTGGESMIGKLQNMSYDSALDALTSASTQSGLISLLSGKILGVQFATPNVWQNSSYNSTLNLFIKLAAPSGDPLSILKYITLPILTMMSAGSPITINGVTYAMPLIWDVRAYGITHFKIGAIAAMTISRGSYETVFNSAKQPLLVDVRLTIVPLMQDFAVQYSGKATGRIGSTVIATANEFKTGIDTIEAATKDAVAVAKSSIGESSLGKTISAAFTAMEKLFDEISSSAQKTITGGNTGGSIYGGNGLGVQSPGDEIDGLMGIAYGGPTGIKNRDKLMEISEYPDDSNGYIKGFANSYTFKI